MRARRAKSGRPDRLEELGLTSFLELEERLGVIVRDASVLSGAIANYVNQDEDGTALSCFAGDLVVKLCQLRAAFEKARGPEKVEDLEERAA